MNPLRGSMGIKQGGPAAMKYAPGQVLPGRFYDPWQLFLEARYRATLLDGNTKIHICRGQALLVITGHVFNGALDQGR